MFGFCCRRLQSLVPSCSTIYVHSSVTRFQKACSFSRPYSSLSLGSETDYDIAEDGKAHSFTVSYFINTFGFSPPLALSLSQKPRLRFRSAEKPDLVIKLLKHYGISGTHVSEIVKKYPYVLLIKPEKTLLPKLEFLSSIGVKGIDLTRFILRSPKVLSYSLERHFRPCYNIIRTLPIGEEKVGLFMRNSFRMLSVKVLCNAATNLSFLKSLGVPESSFSLCSTYYLIAVSRDTAKFKEYVAKVISMGFCPSSKVFMRALYVICVMSGTKWAQRMKFYRKWGLSEDDVLSAFRKSPMFMCLRKENVSIKLDFFRDKMDWQPASVAQHPNVLTYNLEKWIIPRCSVIRTLLLKGFIREGGYSITSVTLTEKPFLDKFVKKYQEQVPDLLSIFQGKLVLRNWA